MKETKFIEQNKEKWSQFEHDLQTGQRDPEQLNNLFIQITDDLSYARTFYPNRSVRVYMNHLGQRIFHNIYKGKKIQYSRFWTFWTDELPQVIWESRRALQLSLAVFILSFGIGVLSSMINPDFSRIVLGEGYVDATLENIEKGDPMAVYKDVNQTAMFAGIALNNLWVSLKTALFGVFASVGTLFMMLYNGIMVGAFQYFFIQKGLFVESFLTIWIHGTLEISAIIIAGGAGLIAGSGLLFPGSFTRIQAFRISIRRGLKIFLGIVPVIVLAAIFEGFVTRYTDMAWQARLGIILCSLAFVLFYFVWLPWSKARRGLFDGELEDYDLSAQSDTNIDFNAIKTSGEVVSDVFTLLKRNPLLTFGVILGGAGIFTLAAAGLSDNPTESFFYFPKSRGGGLTGIQSFYGAGFTDPIRWLLLSTLTIVALIGYRMIALEWEEKDRPSWTVGRILSLPLLVLPGLFFMGYLNIGFVSTLIGQLDNFWILAVFSVVTLALVLMVPIPMIGIWAATLWFETQNPFVAIYKSFSRLRFNFESYFLLGFFLSGFGLVMILFLDTELWTILLTFFSWLVPAGEVNMQIYSTFITTFVASAFLIFLWLMIVLGGALQYYSCREVSEAPFLNNSIEAVGKTRMIRGIAKE